MRLTNCRECGRRISKRAIRCPGCGAPVKRISSILAVGCLAVTGMFSFVLCAGLIGIGSNISEYEKTPITHQKTPIVHEKTPIIQEKRPITPPRSQPDLSLDILNGVDYTVINDETLHDIKRTIDIRLKEKITKEQLRALAFKLKSKNPNEFERTFICYLLPGMKLNAGAWATTHFNPDLEVRILGLTVDEDKKLRQLPENQPPGYLGSWLIEDGEFSRRISIYKKEGVFYMETMFNDGGTGEDQLVEKKYDGGRKFMKLKKAGPKNDFYIIDPNSNLQIWSLDIDDSHVLYKNIEKLH